MVQRKSRRCNPSVPLAIALVLVSVGMLAGCSAVRTTVGKTFVAKPVLPDAKHVSVDSLVIHSDFRFPRRQELVETLVAIQGRLETELKLPASDERIDIFLFEDSRQFRQFLDHRYPSFPDRRAFFLKSADHLHVLTHWNSRIAEDLRHEVTHACLHRVLPDVPIWLDEGIAEYYEVSESRAGLNRQHVYLLNDAIQDGQWKPDLGRLENLRDPGQLNQLDYAESWLWVHFMLHENSATQKFLQEQLARIRMAPDAVPFYPELEKIFDDLDQTLTSHLSQLAVETATER